VTDDLAGHAAELRAAFDQSFAVAPASGAVTTVDLLAVRIAGRSYAMRLSEIAAVVAGRRVVAVPALARGLVGIAGIRGHVIAVYELRGLLGLGAGGGSRYLVRLAAEPSVAVVVDELEGHLRVAADAIVPASAATGGHLRGAVTGSAEPRALVDLGSVLETILAAARRPQEQ
jgi:chemotaxis signal transduction protein